MADIFLSYAREDVDSAKKLAEALKSTGWSVFWDRSNIYAGQDVDEVIEQEIEQTRCMIVAWSNASKKSDWVRGEADIARERRILVPIRFESVSPPIAFRALHTDDLINWDGDQDNEAFRKLLRSVNRLVGSPPANFDQIQAAHTIDSNPAKSSKPEIIKPKPSVSSKPAFIEPEMVCVLPGHFHMGSNFCGDEKPVHRVTFTKPFKIAKHTVTFEQYDLFAKATYRDLPNDKGWGRAERPVINVSWGDAIEYAKWLSSLSGNSYRLPSEAEWEFSVRAGKTSDYFWKDQDEAKDFAWFIDNSGSKTHQVGELKPNAFDLYDMAGNVWEWVQDCWHENFQNGPANGSAWQDQNNGNCDLRVLRGGSWYSRQADLRSAIRYRLKPSNRNDTIGFRLAQD